MPLPAGGGGGGGGDGGSGAAAGSPSCAVCGSMAGLKACSRCQEVYYCSRDHQTAHWKIHKKTCGK